ncbi:hypothetical protein FWF93_00285 [Candidatus Saccharibacteria bacterium]|nr:hypothetical protein [Candidatus Saccharibacteria bacterium]
MKSSRWSILGILMGSLLLFLVLHLIFRTAIITDNWDYWELAGLFDMDSEISLFTWFSTTILLFVPAVLAFFVGWVKRQNQEKLSWGWFLLGAAFMYLSIDDAAMIHEKISTLNRMTGLQDVLSSINPALFGWSWWVIYLPIVAVLVMIMTRWFLTLPTRTKVMIVLAAVLAIGGQVGMEAISSFVSNSTGEYINPVWRGLQKFTGRSGLALFLFAIIDYILSTPQLKTRLDALVKPRAKTKKK